MPFQANQTPSQYPFMASLTVAPSLVLVLQTRRKTSNRPTGIYRRLRIFASEDPDRTNTSQGKGKPGVDTRIHWENDDEGWIGAKSKKEENEKTENLGEKFADLLKNSSDSHYQFLGIPAEADLEEIKAAYRRLSKEYHPDTTSMPLKAASDKFMRLRDAYDVLSDKEKRRFYDWSLAQEIASRQAERMRMKLEDPYEQDLKNWESVPDMVDRLGGKNLELSDQAMTAITIDGAIILFSICCLIYVTFFKEPY